MKRLTRRELAKYVAAELTLGNTGVVDKLAGYLIESRRTREAMLIVRDIESALARKGVVVAHVVSAHTLSDSGKVSLSELLTRVFEAKKLFLEESVKPEMLGGVKITVADMELDGTAKRVIQQLKAVKV